MEYSTLQMRKYFKKYIYSVCFLNKAIIVNIADRGMSVCMCVDVKVCHTDYVCLCHMMSFRWSPSASRGINQRAKHLQKSSASGLSSSPSDVSDTRSRGLTDIKFHLALPPAWKMCPELFSCPFTAFVTSHSFFFLYPDLWWPLWHAHVCAVRGFLRCVRW